MKFILILTLLGSGYSIVPAINSTVYDSQKACEVAKEAIIKDLVEAEIAKVETLPKTMVRKEKAEARNFSAICVSQGEVKPDVND